MHARITFKTLPQDTEDHGPQIRKREAALAESAQAAWPHPDHDEPSPSRWCPQAGWPYQFHDEPSPGLLPRDVGGRVCPALPANRRRAVGELPVHLSSPPERAG